MELDNTEKYQAIIYPFYMALDEAIKMTFLLKNEENISLENSISKSAILNCTIVIEAFANSLISNLELPLVYEKSIEKLDSISKIQTFYMIWQKNPSLDRGAKCVQVFQELISIRNDYVHPKKYKLSVSEDINGNYIIPIEGKYNILQIPKNSNVWNAENAMCCMNALLESLDSFIMDILVLCNKKVEEITFYNIQAKNESNKRILIPPKPFPWENDMYKLFYTPRFLKRLESHDLFCRKNK